MIDNKLNSSPLHRAPSTVADGRGLDPPVVALITSTFPFGAGEEFLRAEILALKKLGCRLTIVPAAPRSNRWAQPDLDIDVVRFAVLAPKTLFRALRGLRRNWRGAMRAFFMIARSQNRLRSKLKNFALIPTGLAVADEVSVRGIRHLHAYWLTGPATVALVASQVSGVSWSYTAHSGDVFWENNLIAEKTKLAGFGRVICERSHQGILSQSLDGERTQLEVIHLGVAVPGQPAKLDANPSPRAIRLLCPAYLFPWKGHVYLLEALRKAIDSGIDCRCVFAGKGPLRERLAREIQRLGLEDVVSMPGMIPHDELLQQLLTGAYDAVVLASIDLEGIPVSLMEAMAAGIPCIATRTGAIPELINDSQCGLLVNRRDSDALSGAIVALASDPQGRKKMGEQARRRVLEAFDAEASANALLQLMNEVRPKEERSRIGAPAAR